MTHHRNIKDFLAPVNPFSGNSLISKIIRPKADSLAKSRLTKIKNNGNTFVVVHSPDKKNVSYLKKKYGLHPLHLEDIVSTIQRPKIDLEEGYIFFVFHFPQLNPDTKKINSVEIDFILTRDDLVMIIDEPFNAVEEIIGKLVQKRMIRSQYFGSGPGFLLYHILDKLIDSIFPLLDILEKGIEDIDREVFSAQLKNVAEELSFLRRNVIFFQTIVRPQINAFVRLQETEHVLLPKTLKVYFHNITDHLKKIGDRLEDTKEMSDNLSSTFESFITYKTNEIIKVLTMVSVILLPLTLLSGIYGMNLAVLPLAEHPAALVIITFLMLGIVFTMLSFLKYKHWI